MTTSHESTRKVVHIHSISFNSDRSFFTVCMDEGLRVYQADPLELYQCLPSSACGSVRVAEQLDRSCAIAVSGGGAWPRIPANVVMLYNFVTNAWGARFKVPSDILNLLIRDDKLVTVTAREVQVFEVSVFPLNCIERGASHMTCSNELGLCQMSRDHAEHHVLCFPGSVPGSVQIVGLSGRGTEQSARSVLRAHQNVLQCLRLSSDGRILATASRTGSIIRLWCTQQHTKLIEFRRGIDQALIYDIDISSDNMFLGCVSDKRTLHVFAIRNSTLNMTSNLSGLGPVACYTESLWGMAQCQVHGLVACRLAVRTDGSVLVVTTDGRYYKYLFARDGRTAHCQRLAYELYSDLTLQQAAHEDTASCAADDGSGGQATMPAATA